MKLIYNHIISCCIQRHVVIDVVYLQTTVSTNIKYPNHPCRKKFVNYIYSIFTCCMIRLTFITKINSNFFSIKILLCLFLSISNYHHSLYFIQFLFVTHSYNFTILTLNHIPYCLLRCNISP